MLAELAPGKVVGAPYYCKRHARFLRCSGGNGELQLYPAIIAWCARRGLRPRERIARIVYLDGNPLRQVSINESKLHDITLIPAYRKSSDFDKLLNSFTPSSFLKFAHHRGIPVSTPFIPFPRLDRRSPRLLKSKAIARLCKNRQRRTRYAPSSKFVL